MTGMLQPVLQCDNPVASDMTVFRSRSGETYEVYIGVALLERVPADPEVLRRKMLVGRLHNVGVSLRELGETFGHDPRTVKKWGKALLSDDAEAMVGAFCGRGGRGKVTPELVRYVRQLYRERHMLGRNYRQIVIARVKEVFRKTISKTLASRIFRSEREATAAASTARPAATGERDETDSGTETSVSVKRSPTPLPAQTGDSAMGEEQLIHHAGQALFANEMKGFSDPLQRQFIGQILQGAVNVEQSKTVCGKSLALFTGPVLAGPRQQREALDRQAETERVLRVYERNAELLSDGPNRGDLFYFDPHTKEYTGQLKVLKGWCGRRHGVAKVLNLDMFHTRSGRPCFVEHYSPYYDMRERFFTSLELFDRLFEPDRRRGRTFVIDRAIYSLPVLQSFGDDDIITWEKNYSGGGWKDGREVVAFERYRTRNRSDDLQAVAFRCQQSRWRRDRSFRRIVARVARPGREEIEVSVIVSHADMAVEDAVWAIFRRWVQENDFKYLDTHFGLNQLTSRDSLRFEDETGRLRDRPVESPEYRELKDALRTREARLGKQLVQLRRCEKRQTELQVRQAKLAASKEKLLGRLNREIERVRDDRPPSRNVGDTDRDLDEYRKEARKLGRNVADNARKREELNAAIEATEAEIDPLERRLCEAVRTDSRLRLLVEGDYRLLDPRKKAMMDALRIAASNMFRNVQEKFRAVYDNFRDDHVLVRMLSRCSGTVTQTPQAAAFKLWLPGTVQPYRLRAFERLLAEVQQQANSQLAGYRPIRLKLAAGPMRV